MLHITTQADEGGGTRVMHDLCSGNPEARKLFLPPSVWQGIQAIRQGLLETEPDVVQSHGTRAATVVRLALIGLKTRPIHLYTVHGFHLPHRSWWQRPFLLALERFLNRWTDVIVCVSQADQATITRLRLTQRARTVVIPNGIDISRYEHAQPFSRSEFDAQDSDLLILHVSRLHKQKDLLTLIRAMELLNKQGESVRLLIVGDGPLRRQITQEITQCGLEKIISLLGSRSDVPRLMHTADLLILSSLWEGCPLVILEAMAASLPVIASNVEGTNELIEHKKTGMVFPVSDVAALCKAILTLKDPARRDTLAQAAKIAVEQTHSVQHMRTAYQDLAQKLMNERL